MAVLRGPDAALIRLVEDTSALSSLDKAPACRAFAASTLAPLGEPRTLATEVQSLPSPAVSGALTDLLEATATHLLRCESGQATTSTSGQLQFATVVARRTLGKAGLAVPTRKTSAP